MLSVQIKKKLGAFSLNVAFEAADGVTGILGASGCGKSLTLRCIAGIETPDEGRIVLNGVPLFDSEKRINLPPQKRRVGYLFQNYALFPNMTVEKNILCGLRHQPDHQKRREALNAALDMMQLKGLERHRPAQISGGQAQRVALARILVSQPLLLMLDEPFAALDSHLRGALQIQIKRLLEEFSGTALMVTHSRDEAYHLSQNIALMDDGAFLAVKPTKQLFANPGSVAAAMMTGCKNIVPATKTGEYEVEVPGWGVRLVTAQPVQDDVCAVGIRAHYFGLRVQQNRFAVRQTDEMEEPFEWIIRFRFAHQAEDTPDVWWRLPKDRRPQEMPPALGVAPANVLPLYPPHRDAGKGGGNA
ncbi:ATP-binding cassette domain-containing protein [Ruminococcaceae bacterium OttesenSCG-928-O06]|nr:ATP-binding cassette domain-containing protein [Ruminococcaceae bacterium OttesenSCG-928-O06]